MITDLKTNENFEKLILPLMEKEKNKFSNTSKFDCIEPIYVWNDYILNGRETYELCTKYKIPFKINKMDFSSEEDAIIWICNRQLEREDISEKSVKYLIGNQYIAHRRIINHYCCPKDRKNELVEIATKIGIKHKLKKYSVYKYTSFALALLRIKEIEPQLFFNILSNKIKMSDTDVIKISKYSKEEIQDINQKISNFKGNHISYNKTKETVTKKNSNIKSIKDMPDYDPDARLQELSLTMPSWINSIERAKNNTNISEVSKRAKKELNKKLKQLNEKVCELITFITEE